MLFIAVLLLDGPEIEHLVTYLNVLIDKQALSTYLRELFSLLD